jgi:hypothetical protein
MKRISAGINYLNGLKKSVKKRILAFFLFVLGIVSMCIIPNVHNPHVALFFGVVFIVCLFAVTYFRSQSMEEDLQAEEDDALISKPKPASRKDHSNGSNSN